MVKAECKVISSALYSDPQIEVLATRPRLDMLMSRLALNGLRPFRAEQPLIASSAVPVLVDLESVETEKIISALHRLNRPVIYLGTLGKTQKSASDSICLGTLKDLDGLRERLTLRRRAQLRENEERLRQDTMAAFCVSPSARSQSSEALHRLLYIGEVNRHLIALKNELGRAGVELVTCMSLSMAEGYLGHGNWAGLLIDADAAGSAPGTCHELLESHANLTALQMTWSDGSETTHAGDFDEHMEWTADVVGLADRIASKLKASPLTILSEDVRLSSQVFDPATGLINELFFRAHLDRQLDAIRDLEVAHTLLHLRLRAGGLAEIKALADYVRPRLRTTDMASRFGQDGLLISLRDTPFAGASQLARRLVDTAPVAIKDDLLWRAAERRGSHSANDLIRAALNGPFARAIAA